MIILAHEIVPLDKVGTMLVYIAVLRAARVLISARSNHLLVPNLQIFLLLSHLPKHLLLLTPITRYRLLSLLILLARGPRTGCSDTYHWLRLLLIGAGLGTLRPLVGEHVLLHLCQVLLVLDHLGCAGTFRAFLKNRLDISLHLNRIFLVDVVILLFQWIRFV